MGPALPAPMGGEPALGVITLYPTGGPVDHYLTLRGAGPEVELGAVLTKEQRLALYDEVSAQLRLSQIATTPGAGP